jgi:hypothetical protein
MVLICPYCKTPLVPWDSYTFYCECHPLRNFKNKGERTFSWRYFSNKWEYIKGDEFRWSIPDEVPVKKEVFIFR